jgi:uncharacterized protein (TIGR00730 family)
MAEMRQRPPPLLDPAFLESAAARPIRFLSEYLEPEDRLERLGVRDTVVFLGSSQIPEPAAAKAALEEARAAGGDLAQAERMLAMSAFHEHARALAWRLTRWSAARTEDGHRFVVCTGGGPGLMASANRGARDAGGATMGLNIALAEAQPTNPHVPAELSFEFRCFFMRKFWFAYIAKAIVVLPGGLGTLDELFELLTLKQTGKVPQALPIVLLGADFWHEVIDFEALVRYGTVRREDLALFRITDSVDEAFAFLTEQLGRMPLATPGPAMAP